MLVTLTGDSTGRSQTELGDPITSSLLTMVPEGAGYPIVTSDAILEWIVDTLTSGFVASTRSADCITTDLRRAAASSLVAVVIKGAGEPVVAAEPVLLWKLQTRIVEFIAYTDHTNL